MFMSPLYCWSLTHSEGLHGAFRCMSYTLKSTLLHMATGKSWCVQVHLTNCSHAGSWKCEETDITRQICCDQSLQSALTPTRVSLLCVCLCEHLLDVFSFLVLFAVVLLLAQREELLLLLFLQLCEPLAAFLIQLTQLLVQGRQRVFGPTADTHTHTHTHTQREHPQNETSLTFFSTAVLTL